MANNYPYYVCMFFDAGILRKMLHGQKFNTYAEINAVVNVLPTGNKSDIYKKFFNEHQIMILEYTSQYKGKVISLYNFGEHILVNNPITQ